MNIEMRKQIFQQSDSFSFFAPFRAFLRAKIIFYQTDTSFLSAIFNNPENMANLHFVTKGITNISVQIIWRNENLPTQYSFLQRAAWTGLKVHRVRVMPGRMLEETDDLNKINVAISGQMTTKKISASGNVTITKGKSGNL